MPVKPTPTEFKIVADYIEQDAHPGLNDYDTLLDAVRVLRSYEGASRAEIGVLNILRCPKCRSENVEAWNLRIRYDDEGNAHPESGKVKCSDCQHTWSYE